jgi:hypothetical protein
VYCMKKGAAAAILMAAAISLSGCSFAGLDAQTLMQAPKPTGENEADIQNLLEKTAGTQFTLKYPVSGQYRSAILEHDLSGDNTGEVIAFYRKSSDTTEGTSIVFMQKKDSAWKVIGTFTNQSAQVDRVCFGDLDGDGEDDAVVGWGSSLNNNASVSAYFLRDGKMSEQRLNLSYTDLKVMDFTGDGRSEIFTASVTEGNQPAEARLTRVNGTEMEVIGSAPLDTGVTQYASVKTGLLNEKQKGVVLDGVKASNVTVTELLYWDAQQKALVSPFYDESTKTVKSTARTTSVRSKDINGDTIIEIPIVSLMPGYSDGTADEADCLTSWQRYDTQNNTFVRVVSMVINYADGYYISIPDMWRGKITTKMDPATRSFTFYQWMQSAQDAAGVLGPQLLRLEVFTKKEWSAESGTAGYFELKTKGNLVFAATLPSAANSLSLTAQEVREAFRLIDGES